VWTPKRVLILIGTFTLFTLGYVVYAYFLGGIDGLPPLPSGYVLDPDAPPQPFDPEKWVGETDKKLRQAFGEDCEEVRRRITLNLHSKGWVLAADRFDIENDGRVKLAPFSAAIFPKNHSAGPVPEINTIQCDVAFLTLDQPVTNAAELGNRKVVGVELIGSNTRKINIINNRRTTAKNDDLEVWVTNAPLIYEEPRNLVRTTGYVTLLDMQTRPHPTEIKGKGLELTLTREEPAAKTKPRARMKGDIQGVDRLVLKEDVVMHLHVDGGSFLAGGQESKKAATEPVEKAHIFITTLGSFVYDVQKDLAQFESPVFPPGNPPSTPEQQVKVIREHKNRKEDRLFCDHLTLQLRRKESAEQRAASEAGKGTDREIEMAHATARKGKEVVLAMETENLDAYCSELIYRCPTKTMGPQTILKGQPELRAAKDGHEIRATELHLIGADKNGIGQQAYAKGPGRIDLFDKSKSPEDPRDRQYPFHAVFKDFCVFVKDKDGDRLLDLLTFSGDAAFRDDEHDQELHGQRLQVWLEPSGRGEAAPAPDVKQSTPAGSRLRPYKVDAFERVSMRSPELIIPQTHHLVVRFRDELPAGDRLPDALAGASASAATIPLSPTPKAENVTPGRPESAVQPKETRRPIELRANEVVSYITRAGTKNELKELVTEGGVHVHQDGAKPEDKGVDIKGEMLNLIRDPKGDVLIVFGDSRKPAELQLGELILIGPKVTINQRYNTAEVPGGGAMSLPSKTTFEGGKPAKPGTRLTVYWNTEMIFRDGKYADFHGGVQAVQDNATMKCDSLQAVLDRAVSFKEGQKDGQNANVDSLVCHKKVWIVDEKKDEAGKLVHYHRLTAYQLKMDNLEEKVHAYGPGKLYGLAYGSSDPTVLPPGAVKDVSAQGAAKKELMLTRIDFDGWMFSDNKEKARNTKFYDNVEVYHQPADNPDVPVDPDRPPKNGFYMRCDRLHVYTRPESEGKTQLMRAEGRIFFKAPEVFGRCDVLKYDQKEEQIIFEGASGNPVHLYRLRTGLPPQEIKGNRILYNRRTGVFQLDGGKMIDARRTPLHEKENPPAYARGFDSRSLELVYSPWHGWTRTARISRSLLSV
jgi:hypothetical protein